MTCHTSYLQKSIYTALSNTQQMLHCFFFPHEQYSTTCLLWYFAILNLDYPIPKIFFFQYLISKLLQFISCSFMAQIFNIIYCKLVKYVYKRQFSGRSTFRNMTVVQTSDIGKKHVFCIFWTTRDISCFFLSLLSLFEKKFLIWSMRKPRVINIILSSSVKFTVNQVLWMWAYALAPVLRVLYSQLHFRFEFEQLSFSITLKCLFFSDFPVIISTMNIAIFGAWNVLQSSNLLFLFFCVHFLIVTPYLIVDKSLRFFFFLHNY